MKSTQLIYLLFETISDVEKTSATCLCCHYNNNIDNDNSNSLQCSFLYSGDYVPSHTSDSTEIQLWLLINIDIVTQSIADFAKRQKKKIREIFQLSKYYLRLWHNLFPKVIINSNINVVYLFLDVKNMEGFSWNTRNLLKSMENWHEQND